MTIIFDTETTGKADFNKPPEDPCQPRLVQLGALLQNEDLETVAEINLTIKPDGFVIPVEASNIHGITTEKALKYGIPELQALKIFESWCGISHKLVAHNIKFDGIVLGRANAIHGLTYKPPQPYCTMEMSTNKCALPGRGTGYKWPSLQEAHEILLGTKFEGAHDAMADVRACARVFAFLLTGQKPKAPSVQSAPQDIANAKAEPEYTNSTPMPFGKFRGTPLGQLEDGYCEWLAKQDRLSDAKLAKWLGKK